MRIPQLPVATGCYASSGLRPTTVCRVKPIPQEMQLEYDRLVEERRRARDLHADAAAKLYDAALKVRDQLDEIVDWLDNVGQDASAYETLAEVEHQLALRSRPGELVSFLREQVRGCADAIAGLDPERTGFWNELPADVRQRFKLWFHTWVRGPAFRLQRAVKDYV